MNNGWRELAVFLGSHPRPFLAHFFLQAFFLLVSLAWLAASVYIALRSSYPLAVLGLAFLFYLTWQFFGKPIWQTPLRLSLLRDFLAFRRDEKLSTRPAPAPYREELKTIRAGLDKEGISCFWGLRGKMSLALLALKRTAESVASAEPTADKRTRLLAVQAARLTATGALIFFLLWLPFLLISLAFTLGRPLLTAVVIQALGLCFALFLYAALAQPLLLLRLVQQGNETDQTA